MKAELCEALKVVVRCSRNIKRGKMRGNVEIIMPPEYFAAIQVALIQATPLERKGKV